MSAPAASRTSPPRRGPASAISLVLLVLEGYVYLLATVAVFVAVVAFLVWGIVARRPFVALTTLFVGLPAVAVAAAAIRALFFRLPEPRGVVLTAADAPALVALVDDVRREVGGPRVHRLVVSGVFNASALQMARLGIFWPRNTLAIGYPLFLALSPEQLRAVVAHELAHLSHAHGRLASWVYRTRVSWLRLLAVLGQRQTVPIFVHLIVRFYVPRFEARSASAAREHELLADRIAAAAAGARSAADTLVALDLGARLLDDAFWPAVFARVADEDEPPRPFASMREELPRIMRDGASADTLRELLDRSTDSGDAHPCLRDRLEAICEEARVPPVPEQKAGDVYLGAHLDVVAARLDEEWRAAHADWPERHADIRNAHRRLAELAGLSEPSAEETFERAELVEKLEGEDEALAFYRGALEADPAHGRAALAAGRILLGRGDEAGVPLVERSMEMDERLVADGCALLADFYEARGKPVEAKRYDWRATRHATHAGMAEAERTTVTLLDQFAPHDLPPADVERLAAGLERHRDIDAAFLVTKRLRYSPGTRLVLAVVMRNGTAADVLASLRAETLVPPDTLTLALDRQQQALRRVLEKVPGSSVYTRATGARGLVAPGVVRTS